MTSVGGDRVDRAIGAVLRRRADAPARARSNDHPQPREIAMRADLLHARQPPPTPCFPARHRRRCSGPCSRLPGLSDRHPCHPAMRASSCAVLPVVATSIVVDLPDRRYLSTGAMPRSPSICASRRAGPMIAAAAGDSQARAPARRAALRRAAGIAAQVWKGLVRVMGNPRLLRLSARMEIQARKSLGGSAPWRQRRRNSDSYSAMPQAGVSIAAGNALVRAIAPLARATARAGRRPPNWAASAASSTRARPDIKRPAAGCRQRRRRHQSQAGDRSSSPRRASASILVAMCVERSDRAGCGTFVLSRLFCLRAPRCNGVAAARRGRDRRRLPASRDAR